MTVVLAAHGSPDPRRADVVERIREGVALHLGDVRIGWLGHHEPSLAQAVARSDPPVVVVPLLLAPAFHATVDVPAGAGAVPIAPVLAPDPRLLDILDDRTADALARSPRTIAPDGLVLAAAGSSDPAADALVRQVAATWARRNRLPGTVAYATAEPDLAAAVQSLRSIGARDIAVGSFFLASGRLHEAVRDAARELGVEVVAEPIGAHRELIRLVVERAQTTVWSVPG